MSFTPFALGEIVGRAAAGEDVETIVEEVMKSDGEPSTVRHIYRILAQEEEIRANQGLRAEGAGRPEALTVAEKSSLTRLVFRKRGSAIVTVPYCKKQLSFLAKVSDTTVRDALRDAGLRWLRRRRKTWLCEKHVALRNKYVKWFEGKERKKKGFSKKLAYVDGTTVYLARSEVMVGDKKRRRLGPYVYRMTTSKDGLYGDTVGPSLYNNQGEPVKIWGFLCNGHLSCYVLPLNNEGTTCHMNGEMYRTMLGRFADDWIGASFPKGRPARIRLVQDGEKCLWQDASLKELRRQGLDAIEQYPPASPDLNLIETVWHRLRQYLDASTPSRTESREEFLARLHGAIRSFNGSRKHELEALCASYLERVAAVKAKEGGRTRF